jgi:REP element-mobilizing transposase RayT
MPDRTSPRHPSFDYRTTAAYFVTVCAHERRLLFGEVRQGRMKLNQLGQIVAEQWEQSEKMREEVILDAFIIMPNHLHGIICLVPSDVDDVSPRGYDLSIGEETVDSETAPNDDVGTTGGSSLRTQEEGNNPKGPPARSLSSIMAGFKSAVTKRINQHRGTPGRTVWQSRYYDRVFRNESEWRACRHYIEQNPGRWWEDRYHPQSER